MYSWASVDSTKAVDAPSRAITHIQNTAPGPPTKMAEATPARLPVPTRLDRDTANAWKELMCRGALPPPTGVGWPAVLSGLLPANRRHNSLRAWNCTPRVRMLK